MADDESKQVRNDEILALCEIYSDTCKKESDDQLIFDINEPEFKNKKVKFKVRFIDSYPKINKPEYNLIAEWLSNDQINVIKSKLNEIWNNNLNEPIVYLWVECIKETILKWLENDLDKKVDYQSNQIDNQDDFINVEKNFNELNLLNDSNDNKEIFKFVHGEPIIFKKSVFQAHTLYIEDENKIQLALKQLNEIKSVAQATHNIMAYRIIKNIDDRTIIHSNYDDDGETQAGSRLHNLLQLTNCENVLVVVSRHYGGINLGPDRFKFINDSAKNLLQEQGFINQKENKQQKKGKKKK